MSCRYAWALLAGASLLSLQAAAQEFEAIDPAAVVRPRPGETRVQAYVRQEREREAALLAQQQNQQRQRDQGDREARDTIAIWDRAVAEGRMTPAERARIDQAFREAGERMLARIESIHAVSSPAERERLTNMIDQITTNLTSTAATGGDIVNSLDGVLELSIAMNTDLEPLLVDVLGTMEGTLRQLNEIPAVRSDTPGIARAIPGLQAAGGSVQSALGGQRLALERGRSRLQQNREQYEAVAQAHLDRLAGRSVRDYLADLDRTDPLPAGDPAWARPGQTPAPTVPAPSAPTVANEPGVPTGRSRTSTPRPAFNPNADPFEGLYVPQAAHQAPRPHPATAPPPPRPAVAPPPPRRGRPPPRPPTVQRPTPPPPPVTLEIRQPSDDEIELGIRRPQPSVWEQAVQRGATMFEQLLRQAGIPASPGRAPPAPGRVELIIGPPPSQPLRTRNPFGESPGGGPATTRPGSSLVSDPALDGAIEGQWAPGDAFANASRNLPRLDTSSLREFDPYPSFEGGNGLVVADLEAIYAGWDPDTAPLGSSGRSLSAAGTSVSSAGQSLRLDWYLPGYGDLSSQLAADRAAGYLARGASEMGMPVDWGGLDLAADPLRVNGSSNPGLTLGALWQTGSSPGQDAWGGRLYGDPNPWGYQPLADTARDLARLLHGPLWSDRPFALNFDPTGLDNLFSQEGTTVAWLNGMSQRDYLRALVNGDTAALDRLLAQPFNVLLTWGAGAYDLDLHMTGPGGTDATQRFHIYYMARGSLTNLPFAELIADCVCYSGSEVILTSQLLQGGVYRISVFNYGDQSATSLNLADQSDAILQIVRGGQAVSQGEGTTIVGGRVLYTGTVPQAQPGNTWIAVEIDPRNGRIRAPGVINSNSGSQNVP